MQSMCGAQCHCLQFYSVFKVLLISIGIWVLVMIPIVEVSELSWWLLCLWLFLQLCVMHRLHKHVWKSELSYIRRRWFNCRYIVTLVYLSFTLSQQASPNVVSFAQVRLWDYINGCLLDTCQVRDKVASWRYLLLSFIKRT